ncbi:MAG: glycoside hydrolase family 1 protein [Candidatus Dormibacteraceae bacterium]
MPIKFPENFLWGAATSAHQVEGNNVYNDYWLLEHLPNSPFIEPSGDACDHYHRYRDDIAILASLGFNAYRFSIEWARIEPEENEFSSASLNHYRRVLTACHEHGLTPIVTLHHFTSPRWLIANGGWEGQQTPDRFARYCSRVVEHLGDLMSVVCTINEANTGRFVNQSKLWENRSFDLSSWWSTAAHAFGLPPATLVPFNRAASEQAVEIILKAHHQAFEVLKTAQPQLCVGLTLTLDDIQAEPGSEQAATNFREMVQNRFLRALDGDDFIGVQAYTTHKIGQNGILPPSGDTELTQMGYNFAPDVLETAIRHAIAATGLPVLVTESGIGSDNDAQRIAYIKRTLKGVLACLGDGLDIRGWMYWSALDNFEWEFGYRPKFGLIAVDRVTQERKLKPSAKWLGQIAQGNQSAEL